MYRAEALIYDKPTEVYANGSGLCVYLDPKGWRVGHVRHGIPLFAGATPVRETAIQAMFDASGIMDWNRQPELKIDESPRFTDVRLRLADIQRRYDMR